MNTLDMRSTLDQKIVSDCLTAPDHYLNESLQWRNNDHDGVSNHQPHGGLLNRLFRRWSKKTSKLRVTGLCVGNSPGTVNSPHRRPVARKMFPFDDVIMMLTHHQGLSVVYNWAWFHRNDVNQWNEYDYEAYEIAFPFSKDLFYSKVLFHD